MKYSIEYQYMPKGRQRPLDDGTLVDIRVTDEKGLVILPNIGDFVQIDGSVHGQKAVYGKVRSRAFFYVHVTDETFCHVNIVVEETDDDWGALIKQ
ncbi:MAG: hypothetical protein P4M15_10280 [Alphaproteobacteria bacterium]|nr:hypothetical protein [Alphaproteobacteria bacterium]